MYELFLLELTTGMRRGELLALRWSDLDFATGKLRIDKQVYPVGGRLVISEPKTKAANRTIILPPAMVEVLTEYKKGVFSDLMFPSRTKPEQPIDPGYVRKRLQVILERADCKRVRFHDLRHTFATMSLENGMDVKTLSTIIGHVSSATTLNTYTHVTDEMRQKAAANIDRGIAKAEVQSEPKQKREVPCTGTIHPCPSGSPQAGHRICQANQRESLGGQILPGMAGWEKALPECLQPHRGGVRGETEGTDSPDEGGDRCPPLRGRHGVSGWDKS